MTKKLTFGWLTLLLLLNFFSYTQIDLNLTLSAWPPYQFIQQQLIQLGYFHRPLNSLFYFIIFLLLITVYRLLFTLVVKNQLGVGQIKRLIILTGLVLVFTYPAFSHDLFNYIFDVKIWLVYHQNPFKYRPLDFPDDLWLRFMHWTHRTFPYAPVWLLVCAPFLLLGLGKFSLTVFSFKLLALLGYLVSAFLVYQISRRLKLKNPLVPLALWAFNPLVIFEGLVAGHLDLIMAVFVLAGLWCFLAAPLRLRRARRWLAGFFWLLGAGIKFVPAIFLPVLLLPRKALKSLKPLFLVRLLTLLSFLFLLGYSIYKQPQPWYWLLPLSLAVFLPFGSAQGNPRTDWFKRSLIWLSLLQPLTYLPFFYLGDYSYPAKLVNWVSVLLPLAVSLIGKKTIRR